MTVSMKTRSWRCPSQLKKLNIFIISGSIWRKSVVCRFVNDSVIEIILKLKSPGRSGRELWVETRLRNRCCTVGVVISAQTLHLPTEQHEHSKTQCAFPMLSNRSAPNEQSHFLPIIPSSCWKHSYNLMDVILWSITRWTWYTIKLKPVISYWNPKSNKWQKGIRAVLIKMCVCVSLIGKIGLQRLWWHLLLTENRCSP